MSDNNPHTPIDWPEWWRGAHRHFLEGTPLVGTQCKVIQHVCRLLELRDASSFDAAWSAAGYPAEKCREISASVKEIIKPYIKWPNAFFLPDDRAELVFCNIPSAGFDTEDPIEDARIFFQLKRMKEDCFEYYDIVFEGKFKDFVALIISERLKSENPDTPRRCLPDILKSIRQRFQTKRG